MKEIVARDFIKGFVKVQMFDACGIALFYLGSNSAEDRNQFNLV